MGDRRLQVYLCGCDSRSECRPFRSASRYGSRWNQRVRGGVVLKVQTRSRFLRWFRKRLFDCMLRQVRMVQRIWRGVTYRLPLQACNRTWGDFILKKLPPKLSYVAQERPLMLFRSPFPLKSNRSREWTRPDRDCLPLFLVRYTRPLHKFESR
jgi:hypothetical protein